MKAFSGPNTGHIANLDRWFCDKWQIQRGLPRHQCRMGSLPFSNNILQFLISLLKQRNDEFAWKELPKTQDTFSSEKMENTTSFQVHFTSLLKMVVQVRDCYRLKRIRHSKKTVSNLIFFTQCI